MLSNKSNYTIHALLVNLFIIYLIGISKQYRIKSYQNITELTFLYLRPFFSTVTYIFIFYASKSEQITSHFSKATAIKIVQLVGRHDKRFRQTNTVCVELVMLDPLAYTVMNLMTTDVEKTKVRYRVRVQLPKVLYSLNSAK